MQIKGKIRKIAAILSVMAMLVLVVVLVSGNDVGAIDTGEVVILHIEVDGVPVYDLDTDGFDAEMQMERLDELFFSTPIIPEPESIIRALTADGTVLDSPRINFLIPPNERRDTFIIGLENEPTEEDIAFIVFYTGIPRELLDIEKAVINIGPYLPSYLDEYLYESNYFPEEYLQEYSQHRLSYEEYYFTEQEDFNPRSSPWLRMGQEIDIRRNGHLIASLNLGPPRSGAGTSFFTASHGLARVGDWVYFRGTNTRIGRVIDVRLFGSVDATEVDVNVTGRLVSSLIPPRNIEMIGNFAGTARIGDRVGSVRRGGNIWPGRVDSLNARIVVGITPLSNMIGVYPGTTRRPGDSGGALIRLDDNAVLGITVGSVTRGPFSVHAVYSPIRSFR